MIPTRQTELDRIETVLQSLEPRIARLTEVRDRLCAARARLTGEDPNEPASGLSTDR